MVTSSRLGVLGLNENFGVPRGVVDVKFDLLAGPREERKEGRAGVVGAVVVTGCWEVEVEVRFGSPFTQATDSSCGKSDFAPSTAACA